MRKRRYITTAIDYPNAAPHMGHVLEKVLADVIARWFRLRGDDVRFQIGMDEHGIKIQDTAKKEGITPKELVDRNTPLFEDLYRRLGISSGIFMRTSDQKVHWPTVRELWKRLQNAGALEKRTYTGLYCSGCERFITKKELMDGKCPIHLKAPEEVKEENWFFLLSRETAWLKNLLKTSYRIIPGFRENETVALLDQGLEDVSFSRPRSSLSWGVPVPGDEDQTMYVWCDALTNYISGLDYFGLAEGHERPDSGASRLGVEWWEDAEVTHVIGKDIARFHALIWPAMLKHAGVRTPDQLLIHGFLTSEGQKMSKSLGNVVVPDDVIKKYGVDPLRFYLSHEIPVGNDGDFSWKRFAEIYDSKLRNQLGNLLNRILVMLKKEGGDLSPHYEGRKNVRGLVEENWNFYLENMDKLDVGWGLEAVRNILSHSNSMITDAAPWTKSTDERKIILTEFAEGLRHVALMLLPFTPETAQRMAKQLNLPDADQMLDRDFIITDAMKEWGGQKDWKRVGEPEILFSPIEI